MAGAEAGAWLLAFLGLKALVEGLLTVIPDALRCYRRGVFWRPGPTHHDRRDPLQLHGLRGDVSRAASLIADGHVLMIGAILTALVTYLTRGRGGDKAAVLTEIRQSPRLGPKVAYWLVLNEGKLVNHPQLQPRKHWGALPEEPAGAPKGAKPREQEPQARELPQKKVPCFHPFDKKKFGQMSEQGQKRYLKEMAEQLERQQKQINSLTANEYKAARDAFGQYGRNPMAEGAQASYREDFSGSISKSIRDGLRKNGMSPARAEQEAAARTKVLMSKLVSLHEPDMVAGGWMQPDPKGMGRADVNSSIGASWNQEGRVASMDTAANAAIESGRGDEKMNAKLEPCRGKGLR